MKRPPKATRDPKVPVALHRYEGKSIAVFDGLMPERLVNALAKYFASLAYERRPSFENELSVAIENEFFQSLPELPELCGELLQRHHASLSDACNANRLSHVYAAAMRYGDNTTIHQDISCPDCMTFLYYGNIYWDPAWGGETIFYDDQKNAMFAVTPKPGRLVLFNAGLFHRTGVPQRDCSSHRYGMSAFYRCERMLSPSST